MQEETITVLWELAFEAAGRQHKGREDVLLLFLSVFASLVVRCAVAAGLVALCFLLFGTIVVACVMDGGK